MRKEYSKNTKAWQELFYKDKSKMRNKAFQIPHQDLPKFIKFLKIAKAKKVLDLGCGTGRHMIALSKAGFRVYGIDVAKNALDVARETLTKAKIKGEFKKANIYKNLPYRNNFFDAVISTKTLHHAKVTEIKRLIKEIERIMRPGGILMVEVPKKSNHWLYRGKYKEIEPGTLVAEGGPEKGVPHHLFKNKEEIELFFKNFEALNIHIRKVDKIRTFNPHYTMLSRLIKKG